MNTGVKVSIPNNVRKTIQDIKEITGSHSEDEIYAMLKDCSMDPNETAQKLLSQDPFHEVRRKRDRKKENVIKESTEPTQPRWKPGMQGRGNRGGRGTYSSRHNSHDAGSSRKAQSGKENEINHGANDGANLTAPQDKKNKETSVVASSSIVAEKSSTVPVSDINESEVKIFTAALGDLSASDPVLMPSQDSQLPVGTIRLEVASQQTPLEKVNETPAEIKIKTASGPDVENSFMQGKMIQGDGYNSVSSSIGSPRSTYNNRPQQVIGSHKVGPGKEWKPKPTNQVPLQVLASETPAIPISIPVEVHSLPKTESSIPESKGSHIPDGQQVIIPNHLHVPEAEKLGFCFGSFDASFGLNSNTLSGPEPSIDESPYSEAPEEITEHTEDQVDRNQDVLAPADDGDTPDSPPSSSDVPETLSPEGEVLSDSGPDQGSDNTESKQETSLPVSGHQYPVVHPSSNLSFGFIPPIIGNQMAPFESNESQSRDAPRVPTFVVQQPFDTVGYYPQFYRSGGDSDGRISPFHTPKYNGNVPVLSQQISQSSQEVGNNLMLSGAGPTPLASQAGGVMLSSIAVTQQPLPVFRQPAGLHLPHYPPNYIPYGPYFSPFYLPPPAIHQLLSNGAFSQQPPPGMHPAPPMSTPKYPLQQYKAGSNATNPGTYGPYGSNPAGYNLNSAVTAGNSTSNEDHGGPQFKENNVYVTGQQSEGSGVWIAAPGRDISGLQASSFYNLPQGGQVAYTQTQAAAHAIFASIYQPVTTTPVHPLLQQPQTMAGGVDLVGPTSTVYQQPPQPPQINWPNNY